MAAGPRWKAAALELPALALPFCVPNYMEAARQASIEITRTKPRQWLAGHVKPASRIGYYHLNSHVTLPQVWDMPYRFASELFDFPYLDAEKMRGFRQPSFAAIEARYDVLLLSDCHIDIYGGVFHLYEASDMRLECKPSSRNLAA